MKKRMIALLAALVLVLAFSVNCFAEISPEAETVPAGTTKAPTDDKLNKSGKSPKTGVALGGAVVALMSAAGVTVVAKKKYEDAE